MMAIPVEQFKCSLFVLERQRSPPLPARLRALQIVGNYFRYFNITVAITKTTTEKIAFQRQTQTDRQARRRGKKKSRHDRSSLPTRLQNVSDETGPRKKATFTHFQQCTNKFSLHSLCPLIASISCPSVCLFVLLCSYLHLFIKSFKPSKEELFHQENVVSDRVQIAQNSFNE